MPFICLYYNSSLYGFKRCTQRSCWTTSEACSRRPRWRWAGCPVPGFQCTPTTARCAVAWTQGEGKPTRPTWLGALLRGPYNICAIYFVNIGQHVAYLQKSAHAVPMIKFQHMVMSRCALVCCFLAIVCVHSGCKYLAPPDWLFAA